MHNRFKKKTKKPEALQKCEKEKTERHTGRSNIISKSKEIYMDTEDWFWKFNKSGEDEKMYQIAKTFVQSSLGSD